MASDNNNRRDEKSPIYPFSVPEGYFDSLKESVFQRIQEQGNVVEEPKTLVVNPRHWQKRIAPFILAAAAVVVLVLLLWKPSTGTNPKTSPSALDHATAEIYEAYLMDETAEDYWGEAFFETPEEELGGYVTTDL